MERQLVAVTVCDVLRELYRLEDILDTPDFVPDQWQLNALHHLEHRWTHDTFPKIERARDRGGEAAS